MCVRVCVADWMKGVQALGILAMLTAAGAIVLMVYEMLGQGKGDRARLLPLFIAGLCLASGVCNLPIHVPL